MGDPGTPILNHLGLLSLFLPIVKNKAVHEIKQIVEEESCK